MIKIAIYRGNRFGKHFGYDFTNEIYEDYFNTKGIEYYKTENVDCWGYEGTLYTTVPFAEWKKQTRLLETRQKNRNKLESAPLAVNRSCPVLIDIILKYKDVLDSGYKIIELDDDIKWTINSSWFYPDEGEWVEEVYRIWK